MPSASAKLEKQSSTESFDPMKQVTTLLDNKVRNLEKRKGKLDGYKADFNSGKELNEDQLNAVKKYDQVLEVLEFSKDLQKNVKTIITDCQKQQKKAAKRELVEKQQEQLHRLKEVLLLQDLLDNMGSDDTRQDFLNQTNGAVKLSEEELSNLDELYKLVSPERRPADSTEQQQNFEEQLTAAAEHLMHLLDARPKEVLGTTYKTLKEVLMKIQVSGYFSASNTGKASEESGQAEEEGTQEVVAPAPSIIEEQYQVAPEEPNTDGLIAPPQQTIQVDGVYYGATDAGSYIATDIQQSQQQQQQQQQQPQQPPLTEVLHGQAPINFLQDSQVDLESPHMDPAVVVAHPMAPPPPMAYHGVPFGTGPQPGGPANQQTPGGFEPIPTQTYTNQNFANIPNMVVPPTNQYIPVNAPGGVNPMGLVATVHSPVMAQQQQQQQQQEPQQQKGIRTSPDLSSMQAQETYMNVPPSDFQSSVKGGEMPQSSVHYHSSEENEENCDGFQVQQSSSSSRQGGYSNRGAGRGGPRGAPRSGTSNGYGGRPRGSYSNNTGSPNTTGGRGGYQGNYYNNNNSNNNTNSNRDFSNSRRGGPSPRGTGGRGGGPRGGPHQQGARGSRGGSGYRSQAQMQQQ